MTTTSASRRSPLRRGRLAALVLSSAATLVTAADPAAADNPSSTVDWSGRSDHLSGKVRVRADVSIGEPVDGWVLRGLEPSGAAVFDPICEERFDNPRRSFELECRWDTTRYSDGRWSANQHYRLRLEARRGDAVIPVGTDRDTSVDNPAGAPADVAVRYDDDGRRAVIRWSANPEPDVDHYVVEERVDRESWRPAGKSATTSFERQLTEQGRYRFRVAAQRRRSDGEPDRPGEWTAAPVHGRNSGRPAQADAGEPAPPEHPTARPSAEPAAAPSGKSRPPGSDRADAARPAAGSEASEASAPVTAGVPRPPGAAAAPAPAPAGAPAFSTSSGAAFQALLGHPAPNRPPVSGARPAPVPPPVAPDPDDGFEQALPYREPGRDLAGDAPEPADSGFDTLQSAATAASPGSGHRLGRLAGLVLVVLGVTVLILIRPIRRPMPANSGGEPATEPAPVPEPPAPLHDLEARLERLESRLLHDDTTNWLLEMEQLPTG